MPSVKVNKCGKKKPSSIVRVHLGTTTGNHFTIKLLRDRFLCAFQVMVRCPVCRIQQLDPNLHKYDQVDYVLAIAELGPVFDG